MSFSPILPLDGYVGWRFLQKTLPRQAQVHADSALSRRDQEYFRAHIRSIRSPADLVSDRQLLRISLTAFGLQEDLPNRAFIRKVLESATFDPSSFANRLADKRYLKMARAFGFSDSIFPNNQSPRFAETILAQYRDRTFEQAVGEQNESMRLALAVTRDLGELAAQNSTENTRWYLVLGTPSLRAVFETAFQLPSGFGAIDIDQQVSVLRERTERLTGDSSIAQFADPDRIETLVRRFFLSEQIKDFGVMARGTAALGMLQQLSTAMRAQTES